jgi:hypothetical protein
MSEHRRYVDLAAMAVDFTLDPIDAEDLREHLDGCTSCRRVSDALRSDAAAMRSVDFGPAPVVVRDRVAAAALSGQSASPRLLLLVATGLLLLLAVFAGSAAVGAILSQQQQPIDLTAFERVHWQTDIVDLRADDLWIESNGRRLSGAGTQVTLASDPSEGNMNLEANWLASGLEVRLSFYIDVDETSWWVSAIQTQVGGERGGWAATKGQFFRTPLGQPWIGNVDMALQDTGGTSSAARIHIQSLRLAVAPRKTIAEPDGAVPGDAPKGGANDGAPKPAINLFMPGGPLHCSGIFQMTPAEAHRALLKRGYSVSWRFVRDGFSEVRATPPDGVIFDGGLTGTSGEIIMFVAPAADAANKPNPGLDFSDCPATSPAPVASPS